MENRTTKKSRVVILSAIAIMLFSSSFSQPLWDIANKNKDVLRISTLFTAQDCRDKINTPEGLDAAVKWCKETGLTRVFIETFRGAYYAEKETLIKARDRFLKEGFDVAGCVTPVNVGKGTVGGWGLVACYTSEKTIAEFEKIFEYTASIFDLIMIDDFLFTECTCEECVAAKGDKTWSQFRCDQLVEFSREHIIKPAKATNPIAKSIKGKPLKGIYMPKLPNSDNVNESYIFSFLGMLGLPLVPGHEFAGNYDSVIYTSHALKEPGLSGKLSGILASGKQVLITEELAKRLTDQEILKNKNLMVLKVDPDPKKLLKLTQEELRPVRDKLMAPLGMKFDAPNKVSLYLLGDNIIIIENFNDEIVDVSLELPAVASVQARLTIPSDGKAVLSGNKNIVSIKDLSPRTLVLFEYR
jgi:hypothetical protein